MLISVVLPVYNGEQHLTAAIDRVLDQVDVEIQLVVVDDGSTDGSPAIARAAANRDPRVTCVFLDENGGVARARERGVRAASGEWIWFVDSDDDWPLDAAARLAAGVARHPDADVLVAAARYVYPSGRAPSPLRVPSRAPAGPREAFLLFLTGAVTGHLWNKLLRRDLLLRLEFPPARVQSDLALVAQAVAAARQVAFLPTTVYDYRLRTGSIIRSRSRRAESLEIVAAAVASAAERLRPPVTATAEYRYFVTRYLLLSGLKDAVLGGYSAVERDRHVRRLRRALRARHLAALARRRDARRLALAVAGKVSLPAYRRLLVIADR